MRRNGLYAMFAVLVTCFATASAAGVNQSGFIKIGGIKQWIGVTGENKANPIILVVHGGPGSAQWPQAAHYKPWEKEFTVAQWDQRGAGHTYGLYKTKTPNMNLKQIASDGVEVAEYLCRTYHKKKIIVLGHSWGTIVAVNMVKQRPDLFAAYVGTGQVSSWAAIERFQFNRLLAKAQADHDNKAVKMLKRVGKLEPTNASQYFGFTRNYMSVMAPSDRKWLKGLRTATPTSLGISREEFKNLVDGMKFSGEHLWDAQSTTDLFKTDQRINTAFFVIEGRYDFITPAPLAIEYFEYVKAPYKKLVLIDGGHFAFMTHGRQFLRALVQKVRPVAVRRGA